MFIAFRLFLAVEGAVNQIWKVRSARGYRQKIIAFTMLFFWGPLLMGLSFTTTAMLERNRYLRVLLRGRLIFMIVPIVVLFIGFTMLFWLVPSTRVRLPAAMVGALVTTALFTLVRWRLRHLRRVSDERPAEPDLRHGRPGGDLPHRHRGDVGGHPPRRRDQLRLAEPLRRAARDRASRSRTSRSSISTSRCAA